MAPPVAGGKPAAANSLFTPVERLTPGCGAAPGMESAVAWPPFP